MEDLLLDALLTLDVDKEAELTCSLETEDSVLGALIVIDVSYVVLRAEEE